MQKLKDILKILLDANKITANELARNTGVPQPVIHRLIKGKTINPNISTLIPIAKFFSISISQLIGDTPLSNIQNTNQIFNEKLYCSEDVTLKIPLIHWEEIEKWLEHKKVDIFGFVPIAKNIGQKTFALKMVELNSNINDPRFYKNSIIIVEPNIETRNRDYIIVQNLSNYQFLLRQLLIDGVEKFLKPLNSEVETHKLSKDEKIIGVIIEARHDYVDLNKREII